MLFGTIHDAAGTSGGKNQNYWDPPVNRQTEDITYPQTLSHVIIEIFLVQIFHLIEWIEWI